MKRILWAIVWCGVIGNGLGLWGKEGRSVSIEFSAERVDAAVAGDEELDAMLAPYREGVEEYSREVVGVAAEDLNARGRPENGVSNLVADAIRELGSEAFGVEVDVAISNFGGLRRNLDKGPITVGLVTELSPFENFLVLVEGKGELLWHIAGQLAKRGGEPMSGMELRVGKGGEVLELKVGGKAMEQDRVYRVVTLDYLYNVDLAMWDRALILDTTTAGMRQRDAIIEYWKRLEAKGEKVSNGGDGRIVFKDEG